MTSAQRILVNTTAQYLRTIINVCLSLYATRLILLALGQTDFGIYSLVAGVVSLLSFMTNALISTTQRYLSFHYGKKDKAEIYRLFGNSLLLHALIGSGLFIVLATLSYPVIYGVLHIEAGREIAGFVVYLSASIMLLLTFITAPFRALFIARENIVYISVVDVLDGLFKLLIAIFLAYIISCDRLIAYSLLLTSISLFNLLAFTIYALRHFEECHIPQWHEWNKQSILDLGSFAGWTIYSTGCIISRTQGIAIILNRVFGSTINAAYGIAQQVTGAVSFIAQSVLNAMGPQIIKAEGCSNRERMLHLSEYASKYATLLMSMIVIPVLFEMPTILDTWLQDIPDYSITFCRFVLIAALCDQITIGLSIANQAVGQIRNYSLVINTIKVLSLPAAWLCLRAGLNVDSVMYCYLIFEIICAMARLPFLKYTAGLNISQFFVNVFVHSIVPLCAMLVTCWFITKLTNGQYRFILTLLINVIVGIVTIWLTALQKQEKNILRNIIINHITTQDYHSSKQEI